MKPRPAIAQFVSELPEQAEIGELAITRCDAVIEIRHRGDCNRDIGELKFCDLKALRLIVSVRQEKLGRNQHPIFRPLKSSPDLASGWRFAAQDVSSFERALNVIYPGAIADLIAFGSGSVQPQSWREFAARQTGLYRRVGELTDHAVHQLISSCCASDCCLKTPVWRGKQEPSSSEGTEMVCLAPCAVFLEFARFMADGSKIQDSVSDTKKSAVCDFASASNPRTGRLRAILQDEK